MTRIITRIDLYLPEKEVTGITEQSFVSYMVWQDEKKEAKKRIMNEFKKGAFSFTGYDDSRRPLKDTKTEIKIGDLEFDVYTTPTTKRPSYSLVNREFGNYLEFLSEQHVKGIRRKGIRTLNEKCYVLVDDLIEKLNSDLEMLLEGREGVSQKLKFVKPPGLLEEIPESVSIVLGRDYSALTDYNATAYVMTDNFLREGERRTGKFRKILLKDSLDVIQEEPQDVTALLYSFEHSDFIHQLEPRKTPKHKKIVNAFVNPPPKRITKRSVIGDLIKVKMMKEQGFEQYLREKGIVDEEFVRDYRPEALNGKAYILLEGYDENTSSEIGIKKRLKLYRENFVTRSIEQNIYMKPKRHK